MERGEYILVIDNNLETEDNLLVSNDFELRNLTTSQRPLNHQQMREEHAEATPAQPEDVSIDLPRETNPGDNIPGSNIQINPENRAHHAETHHTDTLMEPPEQGRTNGRQIHAVQINNPTEDEATDRAAAGLLKHTKEGSQTAEGRD